MISLFGVFVALSAAFCWALATRFYRVVGRKWHPVQLNTYKNGITLVVFLLAWVVSGIDASLSSISLNSSAIFFLILSGAIGIGLGDTALFAALNRIGERDTLMIAETLAPLILVISGWLVFLEVLTVFQLVGIALIVLAMDWLLGLRKSNRQLDLKGFFYAVVAAFCQAFGALISRNYLKDETVTVLESAVWRVLGGLIFVAVLFAIYYRMGKFDRLKNGHGGESNRVTNHWRMLFAAIFVGTILGVYLLQWSIALLPVSVAQTLVGCSIFFAVALAALWGEKTTTKQWLASLLAIIGIAFLVY